jgi:hypothetical protein
MKMELTECSETSAYRIQTRGDYPEESIKQSEPGESLKSSYFVCGRIGVHVVKYDLYRPIVDFNIEYIICARNNVV